MFYTDDIHLLGKDIINEYDPFFMNRYRFERISDLRHLWLKNIRELVLSTSWLWHRPCYSYKNGKYLIL